MKILRLYIFLVGAFWTFAAVGQQVPQYSQNFLTSYSFNPAFAGSQPGFEALVAHRSQWVGINDAPRTYYLGLHAPDKSGKMGFGGAVYTDVAGPTRRTGFEGTYAYHLNTGANTKLSLGLSFGLLQFAIDGSQITLHDPSDQSLTNTMQSEAKPNASFGALWYGERFKLGVSAQQILHNKIDLYPGDESGRLAVHYYVQGSYIFGLSENLQVEPLVMAKYVLPIDPTLDFGVRAIYQGNLWLGGTFRMGDAASVFAGYEIQDYLTIGYSYDFTTSDLKNYSDGTHEIVLRVRFANGNQMQGKNNATE